MWFNFLIMQIAFHFPLTSSSNYNICQCNVSCLDLDASTQLLACDSLASFMFFVLMLLSILHHLPRASTLIATSLSTFASRSIIYDATYDDTSYMLLVLLVLDMLLLVLMGIDLDMMLDMLLMLVLKPLMLLDQQLDHL